MIAVDELPSSFRIVGVPAIITPADTQNMISLGLKERSNQHYIVQSALETPTIDAVTDKQPIETKDVIEEKKPAQAEIKVAKGPAANPAKTEKKDNDEVKASTKCNQGEEVEGPSAEKVETWREKVHKDIHVKGNRPTIPNAPEDTKNTDDETSSAEKASKTSNDSLPDNLPSKAAYGGMGTAGTLGKKVYCTHWIRWGECDYTQQGCLYKHEMPDEEKLQQIGIATYPRWYRIANPEKFNGVTDGPSWHRRPGPAPTDQLWRGPPQARPVEPQTYEDFRSNARPASAPAPVQRQQYGPRPTPGPFIFAAFDPNAVGFNGMAPFGNFRSGFVEQPYRQPYRGPVPRVVTMQDPFRQQRSTFTGSSNDLAEQTTTTPFLAGSNGAGTSVTPQPQGSITEIDETAPVDHQPESPAQQSTPTTNAKSVPISDASQSSPVKASPSRPATNGANATKQSPPMATGTSPPKTYHNSNANSPPKTNYNPKFNNHSMTNGNHAASTYGHQSYRRSYAQGPRPQNLNDAYQPLVPSPVSRSAPGNDEKVSNGMGSRFVPPPPTPPPVHRRFFVPAGQPQYASTNGTSGETNGGSGKTANNLVDV